MNILLLTPSLQLGGVECVAAALANGLAGLGHQVTLALLVSDECPRHFALSPQVRLRCLDIFRVPDSLVERCANAWRRHATIRAALREAKPNVILSLTDTPSIRVLLASRGLGIPVVVMELTDPLHYHIGRLWRGLQRLAYPWCAALVVLTQDMAGYYARFVPRQRIHIFFNPIDYPQQPPLAERGQDIVYVGRLSPEKDLPLLLQAFAACPHTGWRLLLTGAGPERPALEAQAAQLGIAHSVHLLGRVPEVYPVLARAAFCVLPSRYEGLPNALCEAMVMGTPCVATATSGARAVIRHGVNGLLCPVGEVGALRDAMTRLMTDAPLRAARGEEALTMRRNVAPQTVLARWDDLLRQIAQAQPSGGQL